MFELLERGHDPHDFWMLLAPIPNWNLRSFLASSIWPKAHQNMLVRRLTTKINQEMDLIIRQSRGI